jgi:hypothetical protein
LEDCLYSTKVTNNAKIWHAAEHFDGCDVIIICVSSNEQEDVWLFLCFQLGDGSKKCIRYWPDDEISHEHIRVKYIQSESCPYYTRRELSVTNTKVGLISV